MPRAAHHDVQGMYRVLAKLGLSGLGFPKASLTVSGVWNRISPNSCHVPDSS